MAKIKRVNAYIGKPYDAEIEYLQSTGTQYINTGLMAHSNVGWKIDGQILVGTQDTYTVLIGVQNYNDEWYVEIYESTDGENDWRLANDSWNGNKTAYNIAGYLNTRSIASFNYCGNGKATLIPSKISITETDIDWTAFSDHDVYYCLFAAGTDNTNNPVMSFSQSRIYSCQMSDENNIVRDFVPVRKGNVGYMYDKVSGQLFGNKGTGSFVLGPDKRKHTKLYMLQKKPYDAEVEYLESTGSQFNHSWIDSGIVPDNTTGLKFGIKDLQAPSGPADFNFIGCRTATTRFMVNYYNGNVTCGFNSWNGNTGIAFNVNLYHEISLNFMNTRKFTFDDHLVNITDTITDTTIPSIGLFQQTRSDTNSGGYIQKLYFVKISRGSTIVRDFIPVRVGSGSTAVGYLYDRVSGELFGNSGTGAFIIGPDKPKQIKQISVNLVSRGYSAKDYVQDGLVAMWDGIENTGWEMHDNNATVWKDLSENNNTLNLLNNAKFNNNSLITANRDKLTASINKKLPYITIEVCAFQDTSRNSSALICFGNSINSNWMFTASWAEIQTENPGYDLRFTNQLDNSIPHTWCGVCNANPGEREYVDGKHIYGTYRSNNWSSNRTFGLSGGNGYSAWNFVGNYYCVRLYSRALTATEIAYNYQIDKIRFNLP